MRSEPDPPAAPPPSGAGGRPVLGEDHWSRARAGRNEEALEYMRERSHAPGVAEGGAARNHYCMECNGVIPLLYDRRSAADRAAVERCPHCGARVDPNVRAMFNWVETDAVPSSDLRALLPFLIVAGVLVAVALVSLWLLL